MKPEVNFFKEDVQFRLIDKEAVSSWVAYCIKKHHKKPGTLNFIFCSDEFLYAMNIKYLNHKTLTDIITFDYSEKSIISGDIFISIDRVRENAKLLKNSIKDELHRVMIHGVLHLCGYSDKKAADKEKMTKAENKYLSLRTF